ncbi:MAG: signal peptidase I [Candidatus Moranbacteria bacterium RBG_19FT_COMBO_42_6]|nr:MAG: signal peptidase I [Candidatus Moranbacteria bacterium RBG_19FT_COMBO_42_6]
MEDIDDVEIKKYYGIGGFLLEIIKVVILAFIIIVPIRVFLFQPFFVQGASMEPNFEDSNYLIVNELGYKRTSFSLDGRNIFTVAPYKKLQRQEVVVFKYPKNPSQFFIKRIIGLPGEKVEIKNAQILIYNQDNPEGKILDESAYISKNVKTSTALDDFVITLSSDEYFVMGDNRMYSSDSRVWGPVPISDIMGKVILRAWPLNAIRIY